MKIVTWNINGIRTFRGGIKRALDSLDADIICVQETKVTRDLLDERTAIVEGYNSYFSFSRGRSGYSGVATYCKDSASPFAAEEGLTGLLTCHEGAVGSYGDQREFSNEELQLLDNEGRVVITQHKVMYENQPQTVTVINVYCPRADPEKPERKQFKLQFYKVLQIRAEAILEAGGHVIVLGDVNTSHKPIDHCDPNCINDFEGNPGRKWLNGFLCNDGEEGEVTGENDSVEESTKPIRSGKFVDTFRFIHPKRSNAFTCWSTLTGARQTNYGTRIDYIFADSLLARGQFVAADIMPEVEGSDHCPVRGQLSCSLLPSSKLPPLCTRHLPEFAGKQQKLSRFLVKVDQQAAKAASGDQAPLPSSQEAGETLENLVPRGSVNSSGMKRTLTDESAIPKGKKSKTLKAPSKPQANLLAFFKPKSTPVVTPKEAPVNQCNKMMGDRGAQAARPDGPSVRDMDPESGPAVCLGERDQPPCSSPQDTNGGQKMVPDKPLTTEPTVEPPGPGKGASLGFWKTVLHGPPQPPPCKTHREPCVLRTVKKAGPNMGRQFFVCARPQGHASNPEARCNFFAWVDKGK